MAHNLMATKDEEYLQFLADVHSASGWIKRQPTRRRDVREGKTVQRITPSSGHENVLVLSPVASESALVTLVCPESGIEAESN